MQTVRLLLRQYLLARDLAPDTEAYYRRVVNVFCAWARREVTVAEFAPEFVSRFLHDKQRDGYSSHYRKSLRGGLRALLMFAGKSGDVRRVKVERLTPRCWDAGEVGRLAGAAGRLTFPRLPVDEVAYRRHWWRTLILAAYYTGLSQCDLHRVERRDIRADGVLVCHRSKTAKRVVVWLPLEVVADATAGAAQLVWPLTISKELFRRTFQRIVESAGLSGTFKTLRKSSGTAVEAAYPGRGHEHLGNTRAVFERHYLVIDALPLEPLKPRMVPRV